MTGVEFLDVAAFYFDEDEASRRSRCVDGSEHVVEADTVIFAIGQRPDMPEGFDVDRTDRGLVELDPFTLSTSREGGVRRRRRGLRHRLGDQGHRFGQEGRRRAWTSTWAATAGSTGSWPRRPSPIVRLGPGRGFAALSRVADGCVIPESG